MNSRLDGRVARGYDPGVAPIEFTAWVIRRGDGAGLNPKKKEFHGYDCLIQISQGRDPLFNSCPFPHV
jgi:hypothetical protein